MTRLPLDAIARLPFRQDNEPGEAGGLPTASGSLLLHSDGSLQIAASAEFFDESGSFLHTIDEKALFWGASLTIGLGALGGILRHNDKRQSAAFVLAGALLSGLAAASVRWSAHGIADSLVSRHATGTYTLEHNSINGTITLTVFSDLPPHLPKLPRFLLRLAADNFDAEDADRFFATLESMKENLY